MSPRLRVSVLLLLIMGYTRNGIAIARNQSFTVAPGASHYSPIETFRSQVSLKLVSVFEIDSQSAFENSQIRSS